MVGTDPIFGRIWDYELAPYLGRAAGQDSGPVLLIP